MADKAKENKLQEQEKIKEVDTEKPAKVYKILKNVKYGENVFEIGDRVEIPDEDLQEFKDAGVIEIEE